MASEHSAVATSTAPRPLPQYSQAIKHNGLLYTSGSIGVDPTTGNLVDGTTKDRARQALRNLEQVIEAGGSSLDRVLKANIFLDDMTNFALVNEAWDEFFTTLPKPARTCVAVYQLPRGTDVEIEMLAIASPLAMGKI